MYTHPSLSLPPSRSLLLCFSHTVNIFLCNAHTTYSKKANTHTINWSKSADAHTTFIKGVVMRWMCVCVCVCVHYVCV